MHAVFMTSFLGRVGDSGHLRDTLFLNGARHVEAFVLLFGLRVCPASRCCWKFGRPWIVMDHLPIAMDRDSMWDHPSRAHKCRRAPTPRGGTQSGCHPRVITKQLTRFAVLTIAAAALSLGGCAGEDDDDDADALEVDETDSADSALSAGPNAGDDSDGAKTGGPDGNKADKGECRDDDHGGHKHHHKHKFKVLDRLDGAKDHTIVIAALPAGLPDRLIAKLHKIDADGDGAVSKDELKAALKRHKHKEKDRDGDKKKH